MNLKQAEKIFPIGTIIKHKQCNLKYKVIKYSYDLFGEYVTLKNIYKTMMYNKLNQKTTFYLDILKEYKPYENNKN